jgi:hypothetical protein
LSVHLLVDQLKVEHSCGDGFRVRVSQELGTNCERALGKSDRFTQLALFLPEESQIMERLRGLRMS